MKPCLDKSYLEASARSRIYGILDKNTFKEILPPQERCVSPHLQIFDLPAQFDDGVVIGEGSVAGKSVGVIAQEGKFMGGALGEVHSAKIVGLLKRCIKIRPDAVIIMFDSGGVRLQEANAGEIGATEIIRAVFDLRSEGIPVIGLVGGSCGCFGGAGIISGCCDYLIGSEEGRIGVSGPEVIETTMGVEAFDSRDRALVWRTTGLKNRYIFGFVSELVENSLSAFREGVEGFLDKSRSFDLDALEEQQQRLAERLCKYGECNDAVEIWKEMHFSDPEAITELSVERLKSEVANKITGEANEG